MNLQRAIRETARRFPHRSEIRAAFELLADTLDAQDESDVERDADNLNAALSDRIYGSGE